MEILNQFVVVPIDYGVLASLEKALCDVIIYTPQLRLRFVLALQEYLYDDLLFDMDAFFKMDISIFKECAFHNKKSEVFNNIIKLLSSHIISSER